VPGERHARGAGLEHCCDGRGAVQVARRHHRHRQLGGQRRRERVVGAAAIQLGGRARVEEDGGRAGGDEAGRQPAPRLVALPQTGAQLDRDGDLRADGVDHGADDALRARRVAEQGGAGARLHHLAHRAGHVEVDQVGAGAGAELGGAREVVVVGAEELEADRVLVRVGREVLEGAGAAVAEPVGRDHLGEDEAGAPPAHAVPEGRVVTPAIGAMRSRRSSASGPMRHGRARASETGGPG
jgi:hypothetical protein